MLKKFDRLVRNIQRNELSDTIFHSNRRLCDIIFESILPSPYRLVNDIIQKLKNGESKFSYSKNDVLSFSDRYWKFYENLKRVSDNFKLTIIRCHEWKLLRKYTWLKSGDGVMMEFGNPDDYLDEHIWIRDMEDMEYDDGFKNLLCHELGHVWTFLFGNADENFKEGQALFNDSSFDFSKMTDFQKDVFASFYESDLKVLKFDFEYVLCKNSIDSSNFELPVHIDNIIEILADDYLNFNQDMTTQQYLQRLFSFLENDRNTSFDEFTLYKIYSRKLKLKLENHKSLESVKNPIRKLFLIFAFGLDEQIEYFKTACEDEFGKIS